MKLYAAFTLALMVTLLCSGTTNARVYIRSPDRDFNAEFAKYKSKFLKSYASPAEEATARKAYEENMLWAAELSKQNPLATFGETAYTDIPRASFKATHHSADFTQHMKNRKPIDYRSDAGSKIDWRTRGAVTPIKNQLNCGGCWSFSATGNIEGQWFLAGNPLTSLSEQELLSCDTTCNGCHGGLMDYAFQWLINTQNGTISSENSYPFVSGNGVVPSCNIPGTTPGAQIYSYNDLPQSESKIAAYVYDNGPVSIGVDGSSFQTYTGGILTNCQYNGPNSLDHAVLIVGYDDTYSTPYWIIKNQWGTIWGESGYIRLAKGSNQCGMSDAASSSLVKRSSPLPPTPPTNPPPPPSPPSPTPPTPTSPPNPPTPPTPSGSNFTFYLCVDSQCQDCQSYSLVQGTCIDETFNGDSFVAQCSAGGNHLTVVDYVGSNSCNGQGTSQVIDANACYLNVDGETYVAFSC